jgi:hypothetical protein
VRKKDAEEENLIAATTLAHSTPPQQQVSMDGNFLGAAIKGATLDDGNAGRTGDFPIHIALG